MASSFHCRSCDLRFTIGWIESGFPVDGYGAVTRLVCRSCGTEHAVEIALRDRGPEQLTAYDVELAAVDDSCRRDAARVLGERFDMTTEEASEAMASLPLAIGRRLSAELVSDLRSAFGDVATLNVTQVAAEPNPLYGPLQRDRFLAGRGPRFDDLVSLEQIEPAGARHGPCGEFDLEPQPCRSCGATGSLVGDPVEVGGSCPHCGRAPLTMA
jgi:hypothetical protein